MNLLLEEYKILNEHYKVNINEASTIARFYTGTTLILLGGIIAKLTVISPEKLTTSFSYISLLLIMLLVWSIQALFMMFNIFKSRTNIIIKINKMRNILFLNENDNVKLHYPNANTIQKISLYTYFAFAIYPILVIVISSWILCQGTTSL